MPAITLPDGSVRQFDAPATGTPVTGITVAEAIGPGLARAALAMKLDGKTVDISTVIDHDANVMFITRRDDDALELIRHDAAHVLAEAVQALYPGTRGPAIRPLDRERFLLRFRPRRPLHPRGLPRDRSEDAGNRRPAARPSYVRSYDREEAIQFFKDKGEKIQSRTDPGPAADQGDFSLYPGRLGRSLRRPALCGRRPMSDPRSS